MLGGPTVIWRTVNDRPEAVEAGIATMAALTPGSLQPAVARALTMQRLPTTVFGGPGAAELIARHLTSL